MNEIMNQIGMTPGYLVPRELNFYKVPVPGLLVLGVPVPGISTTWKK